MSRKLPPNFDAERAGVVQKEEYCRHCDSRPCKCDQLENEFERRRLERCEE